MRESETHVQPRSRIVYQHAALVSGLGCVLLAWTSSLCPPLVGASAAFGITYHPQSGWFEDTPLKGGTEEGCPLKGVHEGTFLIEAGHPAWNHSRASGLTVVLRLGLLYGLGSGLPHKTSSAPPQRRNGRACSSLTARGGGLPVGVTCDLARARKEKMFMRISRSREV